MSLKNDNNKIQALQMKSEGLTARMISLKLGIPEATLYDFFRKRTYKLWWEAYEAGEIGEEVVEPPFRGEMAEPYEDLKDLGKKRYVITSAQNNTHINEEFFDSLEAYCDINDAQLLVSPFAYNMDGLNILGTKKQKSLIKWDDRVEPYIIDEPIKLSDYLGGLIFCAELDILPTAVNPLSGLQSYTKSASGIFPHAKMQLESAPTHKDDPCRMLYTTGCVTQRNYIQRKAGQKASFHHVFGALVVEVDHKNKCWFVRQLNANDDGSFQDLHTVYHPDGSTTEERVEAINWGDIHSEKLEEEQKSFYFGKDGILDQLKPKYQFCHDLSDFTPRNHHNRHDPHFLYKTSLDQIRTVEQGLQQAIDVLHIMDRDDTQTIVVNSNHDDALLRWLKEADYKYDPDNAVFYLKAQLACYEAIQHSNKDFMIFEHALKELVGGGKQLMYNNVTFLRTDESFKICLDNGPENAIECGNHGHLGSNGARGSIQTYRKLGHRQNIGHSHSASIKDGVYQAGVTGSLDMGYNKGASSWSHSHIITYPGGKRTIITTHGKNWKL